MGRPYLGNHDESFIGYADGLFFIDNGERCSTAKAYLIPAARSNRNLRIIKNAQATKVQLVNGRATGVQFQLNGKRMVASCDKEVIVSAGSVGTPQLLMLSGIGPQKHLQEMNVDVVANLSVGNNLQDHLYLWLFYKMKNKHVDDKVNPFFEFLSSRTGPMTAGLNVDLAGLFNARNESDRYPDMQVHHLYFPTEHPDQLKAFLQNDDIRPDVVSAAIEANKHHDLAVVVMYLLNPLSSGTV